MACDALARREYSRKELQYKLFQRSDDFGLINQLLEKLAEQGLQSDVRFCENFINQRYKAGHGPLKIRHELRERGISNETIEQIITSSSFDWYERARTVRLRKFDLPLPSDLKDKVKQFRFLNSRGFDADMIHYACENSDD